jgi:hypothetical protein
MSKANLRMCGSVKFCTFAHMWECEISHILTLDRVQSCAKMLCRCADVQDCAKICTFTHIGCEKMCAGAAENFCTSSALRWDDNCQLWEPKRYKIQSCNLLPLRPQIRHPVHPPCAPPGVQKCCNYPGASS